MAENYELQQNDKRKLKLYRGKQKQLLALTPEDGALYFASDSRKIFLGTKVTTALGTDVQLIQMSSSDGGSGSAGFVYAAASMNDGTLIKVNPEVDNTDNPGYYILRSAFNFTLEPQQDPQNEELIVYKPVFAEREVNLPDENMLVINNDGQIFRVIAVQGTLDRVLVNLISTGSTSGGGGGGGGSAVEDLYLDWGTGWGSGSTYIYGQDYELTFTGTADRDHEIKFYIYIKDEVNNVVISDGTEPIVWESGVPYTFHTNNLPETSNLTIQIRLNSENSRMLNAYKPSKTYDHVKVVRMELQKVNNNEYYPIKTSTDISQSLSLYYIPIGDASLVTTLHVSIDGIEQESLNRVLKVEGVVNPYNNSNTLIIPKQEHGAHTIALQLSTVINNTERLSNIITYEAAWADEGNTLPIIWLGNYNSNVINYENAYIQYMVYDPIKGKTLPAAVSLYKNGELLNEVSVDYSVSEWAEWDISNSYTVGYNTFTIVCRGASKEIPIYVTNEGARDLSIAQADALLLNYTAAGRSNLEVRNKRGIWADTTERASQAVLTGFNWQSNGWKKDAVAAGAIDNGTYLSLTNGATVSIPCPQITLNNESDYTIEARFRIRNVQKYSTLVQSLPLYFYENDVFTEVDENAEYDPNITYYTKREGVEVYDKAIISEFEEGVTYYTRTSLGRADHSAAMSWITANNKVLIYDDYGSPLMDEDNIQKTYQTTDGVVCKWMASDNIQGLCLGSQEAYFRSSRGSVNVRYKEDEVINISIVVSKTDGLCYIYLNGILSGADSLPEAGTGKIIINSPFVFNSDYCDIDLYRFRIFQYGLSMPDVIHNYLSDIHSTVLYDQNQLTTVYDPTQISYPLLLQYNETHPDEPTMPYAVWEITSREDEKLPWKKGDNQKANITFVNPSLDRALELGTIDEWYYYTHCPSTYAEGVDINVQGTSSQGYPRRNYKTKYKDAGNTWVYLKGSLAGQPLTGTYTVLDKNGEEHSLVKNFHMDNTTVGTNKFTWKIDYMESSGSYNTGFANLMGNSKYPLYTKHPLEDLGIEVGNMRTTVYGFPVLTFHKYEDATKNPSNPAVNYEFIGRYNLNLDKGSNEYFGYESGASQPYMDGNPKIKSIAECWEFSDNQGTWCSFKFPTAAARDLGFGTPQGDSGVEADRLEMFRHFEYRYSPYADQLDGIGADGKYDGKPKNDAIAAEIGANDKAKSAYARDKYVNLERLFMWVDSTDTTAATDGDIIIRTVEYGDNGYYIASETKPSVTYSTAKDYTGYLGATSVQTALGDYETTFTKDTAEYRLEKFRCEFSKHFDKEYCLVYFVLTELLLCYDSRGKNMMLASFGPHEIGGDYVWYPTFYDIDTQLGLNNSGAYLWDYDADVTEDGLFSTPTSVLWVNLYAAFNEDIKNKYRVLRGADDGTTVHGSLTYENIAGAYECNPKVFDSYAMKGIRPIIAIGLDEYYKYFATTKSGYFDTSGTLIIEGTPQYAYACQGDKKLTTELLLRNRLNYIDSWWLGGDYEITAVKQGQFWGRVNGNRGTKTSDKFLDLTQEQINTQAATDPKYNGFSPATYPKPYFDSRPGYQLKPFLKQYVSFFTDEVPSVPVKYLANSEQTNGVWTNVTEDTIAAYKTQAETPNEQLNYIPGVDYLSSMGDLSTSYFSEFTLTAGKRLLDLTLGSDVPGYENALIDADKKFDIADDKTSSTKKSLLKKIVMTGMTSFDKTLDVSGSEKLQEFRALRTGIPSVYFADGAPLHTIHLPSTIQTLKLVEPGELTRILTSVPVVATLENGEAVYADPATYRGLYIEGVTDYSTGHPGHKLNQLIIEGGSLGYDSYTILNNLVQLKNGATENTTLSASLKDVYWCPYTQVQYGDSKDNNTTYYILTDHNTFATYTDNSNESWEFNTLNGLIYTFDATAPKNTITSTALFDNFITWYTGGSNQFTNTSDSGGVPTITGTVFIANAGGTAIDEEYLTSYYGEYYPSLVIYAENVDTKNVAKYVNILDSGRIEVIDIKRTSTDHPLFLTVEHPTKTNYDFEGWSLDQAGQNMFIEFDGTNYVGVEDALNNYSYSSAGTDVLTLYAKFSLHKFNINFYNADNSLIAATKQTYSATGHVMPPTENGKEIVPYLEIEDSDTTNLTRTNQFKGWARTSNPSVLVNLDTISPTADMNFIAVYEAVSVYDNILDTKYLDLTDLSVNGSIKLNRSYFLKGKITLPTVINDIPVQALAGFDNQNNNHAITHIFFAQENRAITTFMSYCFTQSRVLKYVEPISTLTTIETNCFKDCIMLKSENVYDLFQSITNVGAGVIQNTGTAYDTNTLTLPGHKYTSIAVRAFSNLYRHNTLIIGSNTDPCRWVEMLDSGKLTNSSNLFDGFGMNLDGASKIHIYLPTQDFTAENRERLLRALNLLDYQGRMELNINVLNADFGWFTVDT